MKQIFKTFNPKQIFRIKKSKSSSSTVSKSSPPSFGSASHSSSTSSTSTSSETSSSTTHRLKKRPVVKRARSEDEIVFTPFQFDVAQAFKMMDRDGDGKITRDELKEIFKALSEDEVAEMIKEVDVDGDGCVSLEELTAVGSVFESTVAIEEEGELRGAFEFFDTDRDGKISAVELYEGFIKLGDQRCTLDECRRMIESVDVNKDGFVCFQDFSRMMDAIPR